MQLIQTDEFDLLRLSLHRISFLKLEEKKFLLKKLDSSYSLALLSIEEIEKIINRKIKNRDYWNGRENLHRAQIAMHYCQIMGIKILGCGDMVYPELLRQIPDHPFLLFCRGNENLLSEKSVSVVGTRRLTQLGKDAAKKFAYEAVTHGVNVISGLANGADGFAHQGALDAWYDFCEKGEDVHKLGRTIAVLPSSIDSIVPAGHVRMAAQILQSGGCLVSEYEPKMEMASWHFVGRNRIIAGLSPATVIVEAPAGSGALITADFALEYNRDVMFHAATFGGKACDVAEIVKKQLETEHAAGRVSKYKIENRPEKFLEAGAPVIKDYNEYCRVLDSPPGVFSEPVQGTLF